MSSLGNDGKRVCIFVDGENLRHSIVELFPSPIFEQWDYLPKNANWTEFYDWIAEQVAGTNANRIRTYWYVVMNLDCAPSNLNSARKDPIILRSLLSRNPYWKEDIDSASTDFDRRTLMERMAESLAKRELAKQRRFAGWTHLQDKISSGHTAIEFRRAGSIRFDLHKERFGQEKAVDVKLATDLIKLKDIYDVAVIVSGDQDYVPAVDSIKDYGKRIVNVTFLKEDGKLLPGGAARLNQAADQGLQIGHSDLKLHLGL